MGVFRSYAFTPPPPNEFFTVKNLKMKSKLMRLNQCNALSPNPTHTPTFFWLPWYAPEEIGIGWSAYHISAMRRIRFVLLREMLQIIACSTVGPMCMFLPFTISSAWSISNRWTPSITCGASSCRSWWRRHLRSIFRNPFQRSSSHERVKSNCLQERMRTIHLIRRS